MSTGKYFKGNVLNLWGDDLLLQDITIDGYREGRAMLLRGDRIRVANPRIKNPDMFGAAGVRFTGGKGFRCHDGYVESGDDAAFQFSTQEDSGPIIDGAYIGCRGKSLTGRLILVGTKFDEIRNVRFMGVSGEAGGIGGMEGAGANCIKIQNSIRGMNKLNMPVPEAPISDVLFSNVEVKAHPTGAESVVVENEPVRDPMASTASNQILTNVRFDDLVILSPSNTAFVVKGGPNGVDGLSWRSGGVFPPKAGFSVIALSNLKNAAFEALDIKAGSDQKAIVVGLTAAEACSNVTFTDVLVRKILATKFGVEFRYATNCGWSRGSIAGVGGSKAVSITSDAQACYVEGADLSGIPTEPKIDAPLTGGHRIADNYGSNQRALGLFKTSATVSGTSIAVISSYVEVSAGSAAFLDTINGGREGDMLVLRKATTSLTVTVREFAGGNLALAPAGDFPLNTPDDTITLIKSLSSWLEVARSDNA